MTTFPVRVHLQLMQSQNWSPWQRPFVAGYQQYLQNAFCRLTTATHSITNRLLAIVQTKPVNLVPKIGCHGIIPQTLDLSCLHWIAWPRKPTPRIKQHVASCHTAKVISIQSLPAPPPSRTHKGDSRSQRLVGGPPPCLEWRAHIATVWHCFRFPDFPSIREWRGSKCRFWVQKWTRIGGGVSPLKLVRGTHEHPYRR